MRLLTSIVFTLVGILAQAQDFIIDHFAVDIAIQQDGSLQIEETIEVDFNERRRGIFRTIPERYTFEGQYNLMFCRLITGRGLRYFSVVSGSGQQIELGKYWVSERLAMQKRM